MTPESVVRQFIEKVRSGRDLEAAYELMAPTVIAHQVESGPSRSIMRSPLEYIEHIQEFLADYGQFSLEVEEFLHSNDKVYVRWRQNGHHLGPTLGHPATGRPLIAVGSAVYRVADGKIVEYWIQQENFGLKSQLV